MVAVRVQQQRFLHQRQLAVPSFQDIYFEVQYQSAYVPQLQYSSCSVAVHYVTQLQCCSSVQETVAVLQDSTGHNCSVAVSQCCHSCNGYDRGTVEDTYYDTIGREGQNLVFLRLRYSLDSLEWSHIPHPKTDFGEIMQTQSNEQYMAQVATNNIVQHQRDTMVDIGQFLS